jgi:hypothetical protein
MFDTDVVFRADHICQLFTQGKMHFYHGWLDQAAAPQGEMLSKFICVLQKASVIFLLWLTADYGQQPVAENGGAKAGLNEQFKKQKTKNEQMVDKYRAGQSK